MVGVVVWWMWSGTGTKAQDHAEEQNKETRVRAQL